MIAENGKILKETRNSMETEEMITGVVDIEKCIVDRRKFNSDVWADIPDVTETRIFTSGWPLSDFRYWGIVCTLIPGLGWFISFSMLIVCVRYVKLPKHIAQNTEMGKILSSECTTYKKDGDTDA